MSDSEDLELDLEETGALGRGKTKKGSSASAEKALKFLPRTGLLNEDGNIFYHDALTPTVPNEFIVRCKENGIHLKVGERFTDRERELIRANWETFARLAGLRPDEDALTVIGQGRNFGHIDPDVRSRLQSLKKQHKFWPLMCRGLEDRTANMVRYHMVVMFTPQPVAGFNAHLFMANPLDRSRFLRARQKFEDEKTKMSLYLKIAYKQVNSLYDLVFRMEDAIQGHVLVRMWGYISMCFNPNPKYKVRAEKAFENGEKAFPAEWIKWGRLGFLVRRMPSLCKKTFEDVYPRVCDLMAKEGIDNMQAIRKISGCTLPRMQAHDFCAFVRIVLDLMTEQKKDATSGHHIKYSRVDVVKEMERQGIHGFYTGRLTPFEYCRDRMVTLIGAVKLHILPRIKIAYTVEDILLVAIRCLEDYCTMDGGKQAEAEMEDEGEKENDDDEEEKGKAKGKGKTAKPRGLRVQTGDLVAHLFRFTREEKDKNFIPPWKFRRIVPERFAGVRSLFSDRHKEDYLVTMTSMLENQKVLRDSTDLKALLEMKGEEFEEEDDDEENDDKVEVKDVKEMQVPARAKGDEFQLTLPKSAAASSDYTIPINVDAEKKAMNKMKRVNYKALARKRVEGRTIGTGYSTASDPEDLPTGDTTGDEDAVEVKKERRSNAHVEEEQMEMEQNEAGGDVEEEEKLARKKEKMRRKNARKNANKKQRNSTGGDEDSTAPDGDTAAETASSNDRDAVETAEEKRLRLKKRKAERKSEARKRKQEEERGNTTAAEEPSVKEEKTDEERKRLRSEKKKRQQQRKAERESMAAGGETAGQERVEEQMDDGGGGDMMMMDDGMGDMGEVMMPSSPLEKKRRKDNDAGDTQQQASTAETEEEEKRRKKKERRMQKIREMQKDDEGDIQTTVTAPVPVEETEEERKRRRKEERRQRRLAEQAEGGEQTAEQAEEERQRKRLERKRRQSGQLEMPAREEEGGWVCKRRKLEMEEAAEEAAAAASAAPGTPAAAAKGGQVVERRTPYDKREKRERRKKVKCDCPDCR